MLSAVFNPTSPISTWLDGADLSGVHFVACAIGALMSLVVMQLWTQIAQPADGRAVLIIRLGALSGLAVAMLWSMAYSATKDWSPWPPDVGILMMLDVLLASTMLVAWRRRRNIEKVTGRRLTDVFR